ncbi:MAG: hypothetical protein HOV94_27615, partial [Saccharothrix sp.]|nr:hypothetical protein [Saccharothrix sp.]
MTGPTGTGAAGTGAAEGGDVDELADLTADLRAVTDDLRQVAGAVSEIGPKVDEHEQALGELAESVDQLLELRPAEQAYPPVCWPTLPAEDAELAWRELGDWVADVLVDWYAPTRKQVPDCWPLHRQVVAELSWLRTSWHQAYGRDTNASAAAEWHARWRSTVLANIEDAMVRSRKATGKTCHVGHHLGDALSGQGYPATGPNPTAPPMPGAAPGGWNAGPGAGMPGAARPVAPPPVREPGRSLDDEPA